MQLPLKELFLSMYTWQQATVESHHKALAIIINPCDTALCKLMLKDKGAINKIFETQVYLIMSIFSLLDNKMRQLKGQTTNDPQLLPNKHKYMAKDKAIMFFQQ